MRAIWKGAVAFGLVNVPVKLYAATGEHSVPLHQVHRADGGRIRYRKVCSACGEEVATDDIAKGYTSDDGETVVLTDEDLADLPLATEREISVLEFVPADQVDPILYGKSYYLEPERTAAKPYALLREALATSDRMAVVKVALRQRESMAVLRVREDVIVLQTLLWPDEVRAADFEILGADVSLRPQEVTMASSLVESLAGDFDPTQFEDAYQSSLEQLIEQKVSSGRTVETPAERETSEGKGGEVIDLLAALQRSVEKARSARGEAPAAAAPEPASKASARTAAPKKAAAGAPAKPAARKTAAAKKTATKSTVSKSTVSKRTVSKSAASKAATPATTKGTATKGAAAKKPAAARRRAS